MERRPDQRKAWARPNGPAYQPFDVGRIQRRVTEAVRAARRTVPTYGTGRPVRGSEVGELLAAGSFRVLRCDLDGIPADTWPPVKGVVNLFIDVAVGPDLARYIKLHEIGHRLAGDLEEPTKFIFDGPLPEAEEVADIFALFGVLDAAEIEQGEAYVEARIRELVPLDNYGWATYRVPRLAGQVVTMKRMITAEGGD